MELDPWEQDASMPEELDPWEQPIEAADPQEAPQKVVNLPKPSSNMFANMNDEEAKVLYDAYSRHPNTQTDENGQLIHNGVPVPQTEGNTPFVDAVVKSAGIALAPGTFIAQKAQEWMGGDPMMNPMEPVAGGVINAAREIPTLAAAGGEAIGVLPEGSFEAVDEALPQFNPEGGLEGGLTTVGQIGAGIFLGAKGMGVLTAAAGASKAAAVAKNVPQAVKYVAGIGARALSGAAGSAATSGGDTGTLAVGPDAWLGIFKGMDGMDESEAEAELEKRMNIFADAMVLAAPIEVAADAGKAIGNVLYHGWIKPLVGVGSESVQEKMVLQKVYDTLSLATGAQTPEEIEEIKDIVVTILKDPDNRAIIGNLGKEGMTDVKTQLDTASIIERGLADSTDERARVVTENIKRQRKGVVEMGGERTELAMKRPAADLQKMAGEGTEAFGGDSGIQHSGRNIQKGAQERVGQVFSQGEDIGVNLEKANQALPEQIGAEGELGGKLAQTADESGSATKLDRNAASKDLMDVIDTGTKALRKEKNDLFMKIKARPVSIPNEEGLAQALDNVGFQRANDLDALGQPMVADESIQSLLPKDIADMVEANREDITGLYVDVAPTLRKYAQKVYDDAGRPTDEYKKLIGLYDEITKNQPKALRKLAEETGDLELAETADDIDAAIKYYQEVWKPVAKSGTIGDIAEIQRKNIGDVPTIKEKTGEVIQKTLTSDQPAKVEHFIQTIGRPEFGADRGKVVRYVLADISDKLRTKIKASGLGELDTSDVLSTLERYRQGLKEFPELTKQLDDFENNLIKNKSNIKQLEKNLTFKGKEAENIEEEIYGDVFKNFFEKNGALKPSGTESFSDLFSKKQNVNRLDQIIKTARESGDDAVEDGIKAAYFKHLDETLFSKDAGIGDTRALSTARTSDVLKGVDGTLEMGAKIFGEGSPMMRTIVGLMDPAMSEGLTKKLTGIKLTKYGFSQQEATAARNQMVMFFVGPLTRVGARIGAVSGRALEYLSPDKAAKRIADTIFSDPDEFLRIAEKLSGGKISGTEMRDAFTWLVKSGVYQEEDWDKYKEAVEDGETEEALPE